MRLSLPPPLDAPLTLGRDDDGVVRLRQGAAMVAEGREGDPSVEPPGEPPALGAAERASDAFAGRDPERHSFPTCFVCGPLRQADGLRIFPGPVGDDGLLACAWRPADELAGDDGTVDPRFVWAALDCPSGFACMPLGSNTVLASMTARLEGPVHPDRGYVVTAWPTGSEGRKHRAGSAIHDADGRRVALAEALWITIAPAVPVR